MTTNQRYYLLCVIVAVWASDEAHGREETNEDDAINALVRLAESMGASA